MGRNRTISNLGVEHTNLSFRVAAELARKMRAAGFPVTQKLLWHSTPLKVAHKFAPKSDPDAAVRITDQICRLAGLSPEVKS